MKNRFCFQKPMRKAAAFLLSCIMLLSVLSLPGVSSLVLGCERREQVEHNADLIGKAHPLTNKQMERLRVAFDQVDPGITDPGTWFNSGR